jgi:hypothetical protein
MATRDNPKWLTLSLAPLGPGSAAVMGAALGWHGGCEPWAIMALTGIAVILGGIAPVAIAKVTAHSADIRESSKAQVRASAIKGDITPEMAAILLSDSGIRSPVVADSAGRFKLPWRR